MYTTLIVLASILECLDLKLNPTWFETTYGAASYTSNNLLLWEDLSKGIVREPNKKIVYRNKFKNPKYLQLYSLTKMVTC